ncbi:MAG: hypothetical protein KA793_01890 [Bacteroidales bacterium]|nr:hypothetical protein [Bacteroidales bacterium]HQL69566.1 S26 family signal peptidase [Bacteroidales bacterium]
MRRLKFFLVAFSVVVLILFIFYKPVSVKMHHLPDDDSHFVVIEKMNGIHRFYNALLPSVEKLEPGDLIAFYDVEVNDVKIDRRNILIRRIVALPGDIIEINNKNIVVNGKALPEGHPLFFEYRLSLDNMSPDEMLAGKTIYHIEEIQNNKAYNITCDANTASEIARNKGVINIRPLSLAKGDASMRYFPKNQYFDWNKDYFGPVAVPRSEVSIMLNYRNAAAFRKIIEVYEGNAMQVSTAGIKINALPVTEYRFSSDYYFVMSDDRDHGTDSRHFGFVPASYIIGKVIL